MITLSSDKMECLSPAKVALFSAKLQRSCLKDCAHLHILIQHFRPKVFMPD